mmetsp:Transcript_79110/g.156695  ORF Transcript_79110/g.156695 Transcript_79110/m.156695 type:complete len:92 (+) Transcript_79110:156-431(+)
MHLATLARLPALVSMNLDSSIADFKADAGARIRVIPLSPATPYAVYGVARWARWHIFAISPHFLSATALAVHEIGAQSGRDKQAGQQREEH